MQRMERSTLVGIFRDRSQAERCVAELREKGFRDDQIGFMMPDGSQRTTSTTTVEHTDRHEGDVSAGEGLVTGAVTGGLVGAAAALFIPAVGPILAGGILAATLAGAAIGAVTGGVAAALIDLGVPETEAKYYEGEVQSGRVLVTVKAGNRYDEARDVMQSYGAYFDESGAAAPAGYVSPDAGVGARHGVIADETTVNERRPARPGMADETTPKERRTERPAMADETLRGDGRTLELHEEELRARKTPVETGEVTVHKEVITENRTIEVPVKREEVVIERHEVNRPATDADFRDSGQTTRIPVMEEKVTVDKQAFVREEVEIGKREVMDTERVSGEVRREEARIERSGDVDVDDDALSENERLRRLRLEQDRRRSA